VVVVGNVVVVDVVLVDVVVVVSANAAVEQTRAEPSATTARVGIRRIREI
jgi:hypothetical protein